ncbi:XRE family transcriptional regulator, partial [Mycobacterium tuberculosis]
RRRAGFRGRGRRLASARRPRVVVPLCRPRLLRSSGAPPPRGPFPRCAARAAVAARAVAAALAPGRGRRLPRGAPPVAPG